MEVNIVTHTCPRCGGTDLVTEVLVTARQNTDGTWHIDMEKDNDLDAEMTNPNIEVRCNNPYCGALMDINGQILPFTSNDHEEAVAYFIDGRGLPIEEKTEKALLKYDPQLYAEYEEWINGFTHIPWTGVIGDCPTLEG